MAEHIPLNINITPQDIDLPVSDELPIEIPSQVALNMKNESPVEGVSTSTAQPQGEDEGFLEQAGTFLADHGKALVEGVTDAWDSTADLVASTVEFGSNLADNISDKGLVEGWESTEFKEVESPLSINYNPEYEWVSAQILSDVTQAVVSFVGVNKLTPFLKGMQMASKAGRVGVEMGRGVAADIVGFKASEENLTNFLIETFPSLQNPLTEFMANDGTDDHVSGRLRNAFEGLGIGVLADSLMPFFKFARDVKKTDGSLKEVSEVAEKHLAEDEAGNVVFKESAPSPIEVSDPVSTPPVVTPRETVEAIAKGEKKWDMLTDDDFTRMAEAVKNDKALWDEIGTNTNFNHYVVKNMDSRGGKLLKLMSDALADKLDKGTPGSFEQWNKEAADMAELHGLPVDAMTEELFRKTGDINTVRSFLIQARAVTAGMAEEVYTLANKFNTENKLTVTAQDKLDFLKLHRRLEKFFMAQRDASTAIARCLVSHKIDPDLNVKPTTEVEGVQPKPKKKAGKASKKSEEKSSVDLPRLLDESEIDEIKTEEEAVAFLKAHNITDESLDKVAKAVIAAEGNPKKMFAMTKALRSGSWTHLYNFWFTQNILSSPVTHAWNLAGNTVKTGFMVADRMAGASLSAITGNPEELKYAWRYSQGFFRHGADTLRMTLKALKTASSSLDATGIKADKWASGQIRGEELPTSYKSVEDTFLNGQGEEAQLNVLQKGIAGVIHVLGYPARGNAHLMAGEDEFFRSINFRAASWELIHREADAKNLKGAERKAFLEQAEKDLFTERGLINMKNPIAKEAHYLSETSVFSQDIHTKWVAGLQHLSATNSVIKTVLPFVRTVWNVSLDGLEHTPVLGFCSKEYRKDFRSQGIRGEIARGKFVIGTLFTYLTLQMAADGLVVGELSSSKKEREAQLRAGMMPYSVRVGDKWYQYQRLDPAGAIIGQTANVAYLINNMDNLSPEEKSSLVARCIGSVISTIAEKGFLTGLHDFMEMAFSGDKISSNLERYGANQLNSMLPASGLFRTVNRFVDPDLKENSASGFIDRLGTNGYRQAINYFNSKSSGVEVTQSPVKYDWITGETPQHKFFSSESRIDETVIQELLKHSRSVYGSPEREISGIELSNEQYSRFCDLHGNMTIDGKTMFEAITDLIYTEKYDLYRDKYMDAPEYADKTYRGDLIKKVMKRYRDAAKATLLEEFPEIKDAIDERYAKRKAFKAGQNYDEEAVRAFARM